MCRLKSAILLEKWVFIPEYESHGEMLKELGMKDSRRNAKRLFVRAELFPATGDVFSDIDTWEFRVNQDVTPDWYIEAYDRQRMVSAVKKWAMTHIYQNRDGLKIKAGRFYFKNCQDVTLMGNNTAVFAGNSTATLQDNSAAIFSRNSTGALWGNSNATLLEHSTAILWDNSSATLRDNSSATLFDNSIATLWENSSASLWGNSTANLWGNSTAALWGNSTATLWDNSGVSLLGNGSAALRKDGATNIIYRRDGEVVRNKSKR